MVADPCDCKCGTCCLLCQHFSNLFSTAVTVSFTINCTLPNNEGLTWGTRSTAPIMYHFQSSQAQLPQIEANIVYPHQNVHLKNFQEVLGWSLLWLLSGVQFPYLAVRCCLVWKVKRFLRHSSSRGCTAIPLFANGNHNLFNGFRPSCIVCCKGFARIKLQQWESARDVWM